MALPPPVFLGQSLQDVEAGHPQWDPNPSGFTPGQPRFDPGTEIPLPEEVDPPSPFAAAPPEYFEPLGPVLEYFFWKQRRVAVEFRILDVFEERELTREIETIPGAEKVIAERQMRMARALLTIDGRRVAFEHERVHDMVARDEWSMRFPGPLLYELSRAYERAANQPIVALLELQEDPKPAPRPSPTGES